MSTKTWNGSNDDFSNPADWSPTGAPMPGDTALINVGTVSFAGTLSGVAVQLNQASNVRVSPTFQYLVSTLQLINATVDRTASLTATNNNDLTNDAEPVIIAAGMVTFAGTEVFNGSMTMLDVATGSTLINNGTMTLNSLFMSTDTTSTFQNNGTMLIQNNGSLTISSGDISSMFLNVPSSIQYTPGMTRPTSVPTSVSGTGTFIMSPNSTIRLSAVVGSGQTIILNGGENGNHLLDLGLSDDDNFGGMIQGFSPSDAIIGSTNSPYSGLRYVSTGPGTGVLQLLAGQRTLWTVPLSGANYQTSDFQLTGQTARGGRDVETVRTTGATVGGVYRFFDTRLGTQFLTASAGEKSTVLATRSDLVEEVNSFGDVPQTDAKAAAVYRFFDTGFGTHFVTASAVERDSVIAMRPDLVYEADSTFYEHSSQQPGDVAVYRLFNTTTDTQLLTGSQSEYSGLTTPGWSTYRVDLRSEGVAFYAPGGTFT